MDIKALNIEGVKPPEKARKVSAIRKVIKNSDGAPIKAGGVDLAMDVMPNKGAAWEAERKIWANKWPGSMSFTDRPDLDDEAAAKLGDTRKTAMLEFTARAVVGWNLKIEGEPVECSLEHRMQLLASSEDLANGVAAAIEEATKEAGN